MGHKVFDRRQKFLSLYAYTKNGEIYNSSLISHKKALEHKET